MNQFEDYKKKYGHLSYDEKEMRRKFYTYLEEQNMMIEAAGDTSVTSVSAVASAGGGAILDTTPPPFGVNEFITTWKTDNAGTSTSTQVTLPLVSSGTYYLQADWGDGSKSIIRAWDQSDKTHTYATAGTYTVRISGIITAWSFNSGGDRLKLTGITQWGCMGLNTFQQFAFCTNMSITASDNPASITALGSTFYGCSTLNNIPGIGTWDTSQCTDMSGTFRACSAFNQNIGAWNTSKATNMFRMFLDATAFNQNIGSWNTSNVTHMGYMFNFSAFNNGGSPSINNWNTGKVTILDSTFRGSGFNQPIGNWNVSATLSLRSIFRDCPFNQNLSGWNPSSCTQFPDVFLNNGCDTTVLAGWNVSKGQDFSRMFANNGGDFSLAAWDISSATNMSNFVYPASVKFSTASYDAGLIYWATLNVKLNVPLTIGTTKYSAAAASARAVLISKGWTIIDGGLEP